MAIGSSTDSSRIQKYARVAGLLGLVSLVAGGFGEAFVPGRLVLSRSPDALASSLLASEQLFRWGFAGYLIEALADASLTLLFYLIFRVVRHDLALASVFFRLLGTAGFAMAQVFYFAALPTVANAGVLNAFSADQLHALAALWIRLNGYGQTLFSMFYGVGSILLGYLMYESRFLPRPIGVLVALSGFGFVLKTFTWVLAPSYSSPLLLVPAGVAALVLTVWLLIRGIDVARWSTSASSG